MAKVYSVSTARRYVDAGLRGCGDCHIMCGPVVFDVQRDRVTAYGAGPSYVLYREYQPEIYAADWHVKFECYACLVIYDLSDNLVKFEVVDWSDDLQESPFRVVTQPNPVLLLLAP